MKKGAPVTTSTAKTTNVLVKGTKAP